MGRQPEREEEAVRVWRETLRGEEEHVRSVVVA
jgi:hypothetical protein